ncbi:acyltransferase family protein [Hymenobacter tenuis]
MKNQSKGVHLPGLNGIRAIAALAVVFSHINIGLGNFNLPSSPSLDLAGHGVTMFFSLSGFLITFLLLLEKQNSQINIKKFYFRRALRIWPLYFLYLIIFLITAYIFQLINSKTIVLLPYYLILLANIPQILGTGIEYIGHFWSIAVEEQFYLFWPFLIKKSKYTPQKTITIFILLYFTIRLFFRFIEYKYGIQVLYLAIQVNRFDCMAIGGLGGVIYFNNNEKVLHIIKSIPIQFLAWTVILLLAFNKYHVASIVDPELISTITVVIIINVCSNEKTLINLDNFIFNFLGKISYGIYVIHPLIIFLYSRLLNTFSLHNNLKYSLIYVGVPILTIFLSYLSYEFYEKKFILIKDKYAVVKSSNSKI